MMTTAIVRDGWGWTVVADRVDDNVDGEIWENIPLKGGSIVEAARRGAARRWQQSLVQTSAGRAT